MNKREYEIILEALSLYEKSKQRQSNTTTNPKIRELIDIEIGEIKLVANKVMTKELDLDTPPQKK